MAARALCSIFGIVIETDARIGNGSRRHAIGVTALTGGDSRMAELATGPGLSNIGSDRMASFAIAGSTVSVIKRGRTNGALWTLVDVTGDARAGRASEVRVEDAESGARRTVAVGHVFDIP